MADPVNCLLVLIFDRPASFIVQAWEAANYVKECPSLTKM